jgi:hypothetical protein
MVPAALKQAHTMMGKSKYNDAGNLFEQFANSLLASGEKRAPQFYMQAGRARLLSGDVNSGMSLLKVGLAALIGSGGLQQVLLIGQRIMEELSQRGLSSEAEQVQTILNQYTPQVSVQTAPEMKNEDEDDDIPAVRVLPTNCPSCGGPLILKEIEWLDEITAECPYCGNGVRTEFEQQDDDDDEDDHQPVQSTQGS